MSKQGWMIVAALYVAMVAAVVLGLRYTRDEIAPAMATAQGKADWQAWREETAKQAHGKGPVARREQTTAEPPLVILMRDHYATCLGGALVFTTVLFGVMVILVRGAVFCRTSDENTQRQPRGAV
jgi:hypothetical protein